MLKSDLKCATEIIPSTASAPSLMAHWTQQQLRTVSLGHRSCNPRVSCVSVYTKVCIVTEAVSQMESDFSLEGD